MNTHDQVDEVRGFVESRFDQRGDILHDMGRAEHLPLRLDSSIAHFARQVAAARRGSIHQEFFALETRVGAMVTMTLFDAMVVAWNSRRGILHVNLQFGNRRVRRDIGNGLDPTFDDHGGGRGFTCTLSTRERPLAPGLIRY